MFENKRKAIKRIAYKLKSSLVESLNSAIAFGLRVRGDFTGEFYFYNIVIVKERNHLLIDKILNTFNKEKIKTGNPFSPILKSEDIFEKNWNFNTSLTET